jgi:hypothetical protein
MCITEIQTSPACEGRNASSWTGIWNLEQKATLSRIEQGAQQKGVTHCVPRWPTPETALQQFLATARRHRRSTIIPIIGSPYLWHLCHFVLALSLFSVPSQHAA